MECGAQSGGGELGLPGAALRHDPVIHHLVPVLASQHLEHRQQRDDETVEVCVRSSRLEVERSTEKLKINFEPLEY